MEISETKNYKMFDALHDACVAKKDTFLGILTNEKSDSTAVQFCGNPHLLGSVIAELFTESFTDKDNEANIVIANSILNGICQVISEGGVTGIHMMHVLMKVVITAIGDNIGTDLLAQKCQSCDMQVDCIKDTVIEYLEKNVPAPKKNKKGNKRTGHKKEDLN